MRSSWCRTARWHKLLALLCHPADLLLFLRILGFAVAVPALFRLKLLAAHAVLEPGERPPVPDCDRVEKIVGYTELALRAGGPVVRRSCLTRGATLYYFLRRAGLDISLCFGIGHMDGEFVGHCWLIKDGEPFLERKDPRPLFVAIYCVPQGGAVERTSEPINAGGALTP